MTRFRVLPLRFYDRQTIVVARELLGKLLRVRAGAVWRAGVIVEDEAYVRDDPANHAYHGPNYRNQSMFRDPGTIYVYGIHGVQCVNLVTRAGEAVLIRAVEPRGNVSVPTDGPGKVCRALGITRATHDGLSAIGPDIEVCTSSFAPFEINVSRRIGVTRAKNRLLRFSVRDNPHVSR